MHGSNAGIMSVQIDPQVRLLYCFELVTRGSCNVQEYIIRHVPLE